MSKSVSRRPTTGSAHVSQKIEPSPPPVEFRQHNGALALFVQGKALPAVMADVDAETTPEQISVLTQAGVRLFRLRNVDTGWHGPNQYSSASLQSRLKVMAVHAPQAVFVLEVNVDAPEWWCRANAPECAGFCISARRGDDSKNEDQGNEPQNASAVAKVPVSASCASRASRRWLAESGEALLRLVRAVIASPNAAQCIGYQVAAGTGGAWGHIEAERLPDISPRMTERFRAFCLDKYRRNEGLLRKGWDDPRATFDRIRCPDAYERRYADVGMLRDPMRSRRMLDYYESFYGAQNEAALHFCNLIKRATQRQALVGLAYASPFGADRNAEGMQGLPEPVFDSPDVDFLLDSPVENGDLYVSGFAGSLALRDKFLFHDCSGFRATMAAVGLAQTHSAGIVLPASLAASLSTASTSASSSDDLAAILRMSERAMNAPAGAHKRASQVAVIVDPFGPTYLAGKDETRAEWNRTIFRDQIAELAQTGAPFDVYLLSDLFHPRFHDYKVYVFLNTLYLSEAERRRVDARVKRTEQTAVWIWGAGILSETGVEEESAQKTVGMKVRQEKNETSLRLRIVEGNDPLTWGFHVGTTFGPERAVAPTLTIGDKTATRLAANTANKTVFAVRRNDTWTSVHYGTLPVPATLLRNVLRAAGVHLYADTAGGTDRATANGGLVTVYSPRGGTVKVFLPGSHEVSNTLTRERMETGAELLLILAPGETRLLDVKALPRKKGS